MSNQPKQSRVDKLITEMMDEAAAAANKAWADMEKNGHVGALAIPSHPALKAAVRRFFLAGYAMALTDHTMDAVKRLKEAGDKDEEENVSKIIM